MSCPGRNRRHGADRRLRAASAGVMGKLSSGTDESFSDGLLEYPQYTRPQVFEGRTVPDVLVSGDHAKIDAWRQAEAEALTRARRPDLWAAYQDRISPSGARKTRRKGDNPFSFAYMTGQSVHVLDTNFRAALRARRRWSFAMDLDSTAQPRAAREAFRRKDDPGVRAGRHDHRERQGQGR